MSFLASTGPTTDDRTSELTGVDLFAPDTSGSSSDGSNSGGTGGGDDTVFDPERHISPDNVNRDGTFRRKRAKRGTGGKHNSAPSKPRTKASNQAGIEGFSRMLLVVHVGLSAATKIPEIEIDEGESKVLGESVVNVLEQFDIRPDPKIEAVLGLVMACGVVYGPRVAAYSMRMKTEAKASQGE